MENTKYNICKHYTMGHCKNGKSCGYDHIDNVCRDYFSKGNCSRGTSCKFDHMSNNPNVRTDTIGKNRDNPINHKNRTSPYGIKKNTESFEPWYDSPDMRIVLGDLSAPTYNNQVTSKDVVVVPNLFSDMGDIYNKVLDEIDGVKNDKIWLEWHGSTHLIANDHEEWKKFSPTFNKIIDRISKYFKMDVKATRLNWYDSSDYKSFHHDSAAIDEKRAKTQNFTVGVSFGETRSVEFQHAKTRTTINFSLPNGITYAFSKDVNVQWRHGIPPLPKERQNDGNGRISIIAWGWIDQLDI